MRFLALLSFGVLAPFAAPLAAQTVADHPRVREAVTVVETWLDAQRAYENIPGLSAALVHDQELIWAGATGLADPDTGAEATTQTAYSICSISKLFTAIGVMQLMPETARWIGRDLLGRSLDPRDVNDNIEGGVAFLKWLSARAKTREEAIACMLRALDELRIEGIKTTVPRQKELLSHSAFAEARVDTTFIERTWSG